MNKTVEQANGKIFFAVVAEFQGKGEEKLILHEATTGENREIMYGTSNTLVVDPSAILRIDAEKFETIGENTNTSPFIKTGVELIAKERQEQISKHGRTIDLDVKENTSGQLTMGALMLLSVDYEEGIDSASFPDGWDKDICNKMISKTYIERLIIAGALIAAEIDRYNNDL